MMRQLNVDSRHPSPIPRQHMLLVAVPEHIHWALSTPCAGVMTTPHSWHRQHRCRRFRARSMPNRPVSVAACCWHASSISNSVSGSPVPDGIAKSCTRASPTWLPAHRDDQMSREVSPFRHWGWVYLVDDIGGRKGDDTCHTTAHACILRPW